MRTRGIVAASLAFPLLLAVVACRRADRFPAFSGIWSKIDENGLVDSSTQRMIHVASDGRRFRIVTQGNDLDEIQVYDGKQLITQRLLNDNLDEMDVADSTDTTGARRAYPIKSLPESQNMPEGETRSLRFWETRPLGWSIRGDVVASRPTKFYHDERKDGTRLIRTQLWRDSSTGVMLRMSVSVYLLPMKVFITRTTYTCLQIHYGDVDPGEFTRLW